MSRLLCCLPLLPLITHAQDAAAIVPQKAAVSVEVTILEISGPLKIGVPDKIDLQKLRQAVRDARDAGVFQHLTRVRLSTLDLQRAFVQCGETQMVTTGLTRSLGRESPRPR